MLPAFAKIALPFIPDQIVYCKARAIYLEQDKPEDIIEECRTKSGGISKKIRVYAQNGRTERIWNYCL